MAQVCREAMAAHAEQIGNPGVHWDDLTDRQRKLSVFLVNVLLAEPASTPKSLHNAWMSEMIHLEGWQYGELDVVGKRHPNLAPFEDLTASQQDAYAISIGIVRGLVAIQDRYDLCAGPCALGLPSVVETAPEISATPIEAPIDGILLDAGVPAQEVEPPAVE